MIRPDSRTHHLRSKIIAQGDHLALIQEPDQPPALYDSRQRLLHSLHQPSFVVALRLLPAGKAIQINALRNKQGQIVGFSLYESAALMGLLTTLPDQRPPITNTTRVLVTPQGLHIRPLGEDDWQTILWHPGL